MQFTSIVKYLRPVGGSKYCIPLWREREYPTKKHSINLEWSLDNLTDPRSSSDQFKSLIVT